MNTIALIAAFALVESNGNPTAIGDNGKAFGLYQFHEARWKEVSKVPWKKANKLEQTKALLAELKRSKAKTLTQFANYHNIGHLSNKETTYTRKIERTYQIFLKKGRK